MGEWIVQFVNQWGYAGIFGLMVLENVFPPIPSELIMPFAGYVAATGALHPGGVVAAGVAGSLLGTSLWYGLARGLGLARFRRICARIGRFAAIDQQDIDTALRWFGRHGRLAVLVGRLVPAVRTLISVPAGIAAMPVPLFLGISAIGSALWTALLTAAGYLLHQQYTRIAGWLDPVSTMIVVGGVLWYVYRFATYPGRQRRHAQAATKREP